MFMIRTVKATRGELWDDPNFPTQRTVTVKLRLKRHMHGNSTFVRDERADRKLSESRKSSREENRVDILFVDTSRINLHRL